MATPRVKVKKKTGRPTAYKPEYNDMMIEFFDREYTIPIYETITFKNGKKVKREIGRRANSLPHISAFARKIGVCHDTLHEWAHGKDAEGKLKHPEFSETYKKAKELQKEMLVNNALDGQYNSTFAIFTAKNITDMRDKQDVEHSGEVTSRIIVRKANT